MEMKAIALLLAAGALLGARPAVSAEHDHHAMQHAHPGQALSISRESYRLPEVPAVRMDGKKVDFPREIDSGRPAVLNFVYTSCTAICPMTTQVFSDFQQKLGTEREKVDLVSISIDPEFDTPPRLTAYARRFGAQPGWQFYTASPEASIAMQKSFGAYRGDRMNHTPSTFFRPAPGKPWIRVDGLASADELLTVYRGMLREH